MSSLVLSIFPGIGLLDRAFEAEGFCVVRGPDPIWGGDIRDFHPPAGVFDGIIGGDPCQSHSALANLVRAKGLEPSFPDLTPEYARVVAEAQPRWFLRENVPNAPDIEVPGYGVTSFLLCNSWLGEAQIRKRKFWFGVRGAEAQHLRKWIPGVALELPDQARGVTAGHDILYGSGENPAPRVKAAGVTGRHAGEIGLTGGHRGSPARYTLAQMLELQGLPADYFKHSPFTEQGKRKAIGNGVAIPTGRAIALAIKKALEP